MGIDCGPSPKREYPGPWEIDADPTDLDGFRKALDERNRKIAAWDAAEDARIAAHIARMNLKKEMLSFDWRGLWRQLLCALIVWTFFALIATYGVVGADKSIDLNMMFLWLLVLTLNGWLLMAIWTIFLFADDS